MVVCLAFMSDAMAFVGTVQQVLGSARIAKKSGQQAPAIRGDYLYEGDTVMTNPQSNVQIRMVDDAVVWLRPSTEFKITAYRSDQHGAARNEAKLQLVVGSMRTITGAIAPGKGGDYKLSTPNATIGIRGTEFDAVFATTQYASELNIQPGTYNRVYRGSTSLQGPSGTVSLNAGEAAFAGLKPTDRPAVLPSVPAFLDLPPDSTSMGGSASSSANASSGSLRLSLWLGEGSPGQADAANSPDRKLTLQDGVAVTWDLGRAMASRPGDKASARSRPFPSVRVVARVNGRQARLEFSPASSEISSTSATSGVSSSSLELPLSQWTEVTGRGPWGQQDDSSVIAAGRAAQQGAPKVFLKIESGSR